VGDVINFFDAKKAVKEPKAQESVKKMKAAVSRVKAVDTDLSERIDRIKASIARINGLMQELRNMSEESKK